MLSTSQLPVSDTVSATEKPVEDVLYAPVTNDGGCFTKGTTILKGNYEGMDISSVDAQTVYLGGEGVRGNVSSEPVQYTTQVDMLIYGFNGEKPFFTADHPFATPHGWRAIDPVAAKKINPWLEVGPLTTGDYVKRISLTKCSNGVEYHLHKISNITKDTLPAGSTLHGLHTTEGPKSYHANGYLVHMNFPEISSDTLSKSMNKLFKSKAQSVVQNVLEPLITDMHGHTGQILLQTLKNSLQSKKSASTTYIPLREVVLLDMPLSYDTELELGSEYPRHITLDRGNVYLGREPIESAVMINEHQFVWTRYINGRPQHGTIHFNPNRMTAYGRFSTDYFPPELSNVSNVSASAAMVIPHVKFSAALSENLYICQVRLPGGNLVTWGTLIMGYEKDSLTGQMKPVGKVTMPPAITEPDDFNHGVVFSVDSDTQLLKVEVHVPPDYCAIPGGPRYIHMEGTFNWDFSSLGGTAKEYDANAQGFEGKSYDWQGQIRYSPADLIQLQTQKTSVNTLLVNNSGDRSIHPDALELALATRSEDLTLEELFTLTAPPDSETHTLTFDMIKQMMEHEVPDEWRADILGVSKPDIGDLEEFAKDHSDFLANDFGVSYIGYALSKNEHFSKSFTETEKNKMLYYWSGNSDKSISSNKDYSNTNTVVSTHAFIKESEKLQKYMKSDPVGWAKQLFDHLTIPYVFNGFVMSLDIAQSNALLQKQCMVLQCLAPDEDYGSQLYHKVMVVRLSNMGQLFKGRDGEISYLNEFIYNAFGQMIARILNGDDGLDSEISKQLQKLIQESMEEMNATSAIDYMSSMQSMITQVIFMWAKEPGVVMQKLASAVSKWASDHPALAFTGKVMGCFSSLAMYGFLAFNIVSQFMNWKNLSPEQKVVAVANAVNFVFSTIAKVPAIIEKLQDVKTSFFDFEFVKNWNAATNSAETQSAEVEHMDTQVEEIERIPPEEVITRESGQSVVNGGTADAEAATTSRFETFFNIASTVAKIFNIIALGAAYIAMGFQIARDFNENQPPAVKALDISQAAVLGLQISVEVTALVFEDAMLSTLGSALALAGIVLAVILMIIGRKPPKPQPTAADTFIAENAKPFLAELPEPTQKWLDDYHDRNPDH